MNCAEMRRRAMNSWGWGRIFLFKLNLFAFTFIYSLFIFHETRLFKTPHCTILVQVRLPPVPPNVLANDTAYCPCLNGNPEVERT
jgi:hypothetical protein